VSTSPEVDDLLRRLAPQVLGNLVRRFGRFDAAEDDTDHRLAGHHQLDATRARLLEMTGDRAAACAGY
jgi:predicted RNA polymerase sigma factor